MSVRTGRVNGLPCVQAGTWMYDIEYQEGVFMPSGPWMAGFPEWWPRRPTQQCIDCGMEKGETKVGHFCTGGEYETGTVHGYESRVPLADLAYLQARRSEQRLRRALVEGDLVLSIGRDVAYWLKNEGHEGLLGLPNVMVDWEDADDPGKVVVVKGIQDAVEDVLPVELRGSRL